MILSNAERNRIVEWAKENAFKEEKAQLDEAKYALAEEIRVEHNGGPENCRMVDHAPDYFFRTGRGAYFVSSLVQTRNDERYTDAPAPGFSHVSFEKRTSAIRERIVALRARRNDLGEQLWDVLKDLKTVERVLAAFPEFAGLLPSTSESPLSGVAVDTELVRSALVDSGAFEEKND